MNKKSKILIIGFGSIGQRHYRNLKTLGYNNLYIFDINKKLQITKLALNILKQFDVVFVCSPNHLHIKQAILAAQAGCHLFIEKPLSYNLAGIDKLYKICIQKKLINIIGCNMRFHPCLRFIKEYLDSQKLGKIYSISHECGYYLPYWRPGIDYSKNYAAKKSTGGGIILDGIHEFDLLFWLNNFNQVRESKFVYGQVGNLKIETEDACVAGFKFNNKVLGSVRCDYLQQSYSRTCKVVGERGNLEWNWSENIVWLRTKDENKKIFQVKNWDVNQMYIDEIKYFMACVRNNRMTFNDISIARKVLKYCVHKK